MKQIISQYNLKLSSEFTSRNGNKTKEQIWQELSSNFATAIDANQIRKLEFG